MGVDRFPAGAETAAVARGVPAATRWMIRAAAVLSVLLAGGCGRGAAPQFDAGRALDWVETLASDDLAGRRTGTPAGTEAARRIADAFRAAGLQPAGDGDDFLHRFTFPHYRLDAPARLEIVGGERQALVYGDDFYFLNGSASGRGEAEVVFVGYGVSAEEYDDLAGVDVEGKVLLAMQGLPAGEGLPRTLASNLDKARRARAAGGAGILFFSDPELGSTFPEMRIWVFRPSNLLDEFFLAKVDLRVAQEVLDGRAVDLKHEIETSGRPASRPIGKSIAWEVGVDYRPEEQGANVLGVLPGNDPRLADELVLVGAHYDGGGTDPDGTIYNGAEDNASGTAVVLELARVMAAERGTLARPVMFAAWGAEEQGAWGSTRFLETAHRSPDQIVFTLTLDNVGVGDGNFRLFGANNFPAEWRLIAPHIDAALRRHFRPRGAGGSDGWQFQIRGIPALFAHADAPQPFVHLPDDDAATISAQMLDNVGRFAHQALRAAANAPADAFEVEGRLARYLARYAFVVGRMKGEPSDVEWHDLRDRGFDLLLFEGDGDPRAEVDGPEWWSDETAADGPQGVVPVRGPQDLADTEEGAPLRVLVLDAEEIQGLGLQLLTVSDVGGLRRRAVDLGAETALLLDVGSGVTVEAVVGELLDAGIDPEGVQDLLGRRLLTALQTHMERR